MHKLSKMKKPVAVLLLAIVALSVLAPLPVAAADSDGPPTKDEGGMFERMLAALISSLCNAIEGIFEWGGFRPLNELVFNDGLTDAEKKNLPWGSTEEAKMVRSWYLYMVGFFAPFFLYAVATTAFKFFHGAVNPEIRDEAKGDFARWLIAVGLIALAPIFAATLMWISTIMVDAIVAAFNQIGEATGMGRAVSDWEGVNVAGMKIVTGSFFGTAIVRLALLLMFFYLNSLYIIRKVTLTVFFCATPLLVILWCINKNSTAATIWIGELASNAFMPVAHGLALCTVMLLCDVKNINSGGFMTIIIALYAVIPLAEALRNSMQSVFCRWAGMNEEATAAKAVGAIMGLGGLMSMGRVGKATVSGGLGGSTVPVRAPGAPVPGSPGPVPTPGGGTGTPTPGGGTGTPTPGGGGIGAPMPISGGGIGTTPVPGGGIGTPTPGGSIGTPTPGGSIGTPTPGGSISTPTPGGGIQALSQSGTGAGTGQVAPSPAVKNAADFGKKAGNIAETGTRAALGLVAGVVPGGEKIAEGAAAIVGRGTQIAATGGHLAAGYVAQKGGEFVNNAAGRGSGTAQWMIDRSKQVKQAVQNPTVQKTWANIRYVLDGPREK
jgi:hypothetical protein